MVTNFFKEIYVVCVSYSNSFQVSVNLSLRQNSSNDKYQFARKQGKIYSLHRREYSSKTD